MREKRITMVCCVQWIETDYAEKSYLKREVQHMILFHLF